MGTAVDDVHHGNRKRLGIHAADITVERHAEQIGGRMCTSERYAQDGIRTEFALGGGTVEQQHGFVDADLIGHLHADDLRGNHIIDVGYSLLYALPHVPRLVAVAQLQRLVLARGSSARYGCPTERSAGRSYLDLYRGISAGVDDLPRMYTYNL